MPRKVPRIPGSEQGYGQRRTHPITYRSWARFWQNFPSGVQTLTGRRRLQPRQVSRLAGSVIRQ
jgi:hypothetical protein